MDLSNSFDILLSKKYKNNSYSELFVLHNYFGHERSNSFNRKNSFELSRDKSTQQTIKSFKSKKIMISPINKNIKIKNFFDKNKLRKDLYGNVIEKGGNHKVSFKDDIKGKYLIEMTLIDIKSNCIKTKNYKNYTIQREARDKEELICSGLCLLF